MLKIENTEVLGWEHAIRGMRNPMNSWEKTVPTILALRRIDISWNAEILSAFGMRHIPLSTTP